MLKPRVGLMPVISSSFNRFKIVVFPALSSPLLAPCMSPFQRPKLLRTHKNRIRISFSFCLFFRMIVSKPMAEVLVPVRHGMKDPRLCTRWL